MKRTIFYAWQSDLPNACNRGFIQAALESAAEQITHDSSLTIEPVIDRDAQGVPGAPDIAHAIFEKIEKADIFVCDVSIVSGEGAHRPTPNPNVLVEAGYALKALGPSRVVMVMNTWFGEPTELPFDIRSRRIVPYKMDPHTQERSTVRKELASRLKDALGSVLTSEFGAIPGLGKRDGIILKLVGEEVLRQNDIQVHLRDILVGARAAGLSDQEIRDSLLIMSDSGHITIMGVRFLRDDTWEQVGLSAQHLGLELYAQGQVPQYEHLIKHVAERIHRKAPTEQMSSEALARELQQPEVLIEHILEGLVQQKAINVFSPIGAPVMVFEVLPRLGRLLEGE